MNSTLKVKSNISRFRVEKISKRVLPYDTTSICPDCYFLDKKVTVIPAQLSEKGNSVIMTKTCKKHGKFADIIWSDVSLWRKSHSFFYKSIGIKNPERRTLNGCPLDCGLCDKHSSHTALGLIDVTLRCNLDCPICFADANQNPPDDPSLEDVESWLIKLRSNLPIPTPGIQFAGGEPTICENLPLYIQKAKELGFNHIMIATNGIKLASDPKIVNQLVKAGLNTVYLQFDGVTAEPYIVARGKDLRSIKDKAIDNCKKAGLDGVILVPTIVRGMNDDQLGDIIKYALARRDIVKCINFQPVSFTGRINQDEKRNMRVTIPDIIHGINKQMTGLIEPEDWYPISSMLTLGRAIGLMKGEPYLELSAHPECGMATFLVFDKAGKPIPITKIMNMRNFIKVLEEVCNLYAYNRPLAGVRSKFKIVQEMWRMKERGIVRQLISNLLSKGDYDSLAGFMGNVIMLGMMHFMDPYNLDLERVKYCDIHYATQNGLIPFCTQNIIHRYIS